MASDDDNFDFNSNLFGGDLGLTVDDLNIDLNDINAVSLNNSDGSNGAEMNKSGNNNSSNRGLVQQQLQGQVSTNESHNLLTQTQQQAIQTDINFSNKLDGGQSVSQQLEISNQNDTFHIGNSNEPGVDISATQSALDLSTSDTQTHIFGGVQSKNDINTTIAANNNNLSGNIPAVSNNNTPSDAEAQLRASPASRLSPQQIPYLIARYRLEDQQSKKPNVSAEKKKEHIKNVETIKRLLVDFSKINPSAFYLAVKSLQANNSLTSESGTQLSVNNNATKPSSSSSTSGAKDTSEMATQLQKMQIYKNKISQELLAFNELKQKHTSCHTNLSKFIQENPNFQENPNTLSMHTVLVKKEEDTRSGMIKLGEALKSSYAVYNSAKTAYQEAALKKQQQQQILAKHEQQVKMKPKTKHELNKLAKQKQLKEKQQQKELKQRQKKQLQLQKQQEKELKQKLKLEQQQQKQLLKKQAAASALEKKKKAEQKASAKLFAEQEAAAATKGLSSDGKSDPGQESNGTKTDDGTDNNASSVGASGVASPSDKTDSKKKSKKTSNDVDDDVKSNNTDKKNAVKKEKTPKAKTPNADGKNEKKADDDKAGTKKKISKKQLKSAEEKKLAKEDRTKKSKDDMKASEKTKKSKEDRDIEDDEVDQDDEEEEDDAPKSIYPPYDPKVPLYSKNKLINYLKNLTYEEKILMSSTANKVILDNDVELLLNDLLKEFLDHVIDFSSKLAKHRNSEELSIKDVKLNLERNWGIRVPGNVDPASNMLNMGVIENSRKRDFPPTETYIRKLRKIYKNEAGNK